MATAASEQKLEATTSTEIEDNNSAEDGELIITDELITEGDDLVDDDNEKESH